MVKVGKRKTIILSIALSVVISPYFYFINLNKYIQKPNGDIVSKGGVVYQFTVELTSSYFAGGELKYDKVIGRIVGNIQMSGWLIQKSNQFL